MNRRDRQCVGCPFDEAALVFSQQPLITARLNRLEMHSGIHLELIGAAAAKSWKSADKDHLLHINATTKTQKHGRLTLPVML